MRPTGLLERGDHIGDGRSSSFFKPLRPAPAGDLERGADFSFLVALNSPSVCGMRAWAQRCVSMKTFFSSV